MEIKHSSRNLGLELQPGKSLTHLNSPVQTIIAAWETPAGIRRRQNKGPRGVISVILFWMKLHLRRKKEIVSRNEHYFIARNRNHWPHWFVSCWMVLKFLLLVFIVTWLIITRPFNSATVLKRSSYCPACWSDGDCVNVRQNDGPCLKELTVLATTSSFTPGFIYMYMDFWGSMEKSHQSLCLALPWIVPCSHTMFSQRGRKGGEPLPQSWPCSCSPKHRDKTVLSFTSPCFSFASLTKTSSPVLQAFCASLTFEAHAGFPGEILDSCLPDLLQGLLYMQWQRMCLSQPAFTRPCDPSLRQVGWAVASFLWVKAWSSGWTAPERKVFLSSRVSQENLIRLLSSSVIVTGFIWLFPSAGHSLKFKTVISLLCILHNQSDCGGPGRRLCAREDGVSGFCVSVDAVWHSWELDWGRREVPPAKSLVSPWEWCSVFSVALNVRGSWWQQHSGLLFDLEMYGLIQIKSLLYSSAPVGAEMSQ